MSTRLSRRVILHGVTTVIAPLVVGIRARANQQPSVNQIGPLNREVLPRGVRSRFVSGVNGLRLHVLEAGYERPGQPGILLIHGFPELAYSWRHRGGRGAEAGGSEQEGGRVQVPLQGEEGGGVEVWGEGRARMGARGVVREGPEGGWGVESARRRARGGGGGGMRGEETRGGA